MRGLYTAILFNLVLWMTVFGAAWNDHASVKTFAAIGFVCAAISQHCAYYSLRRSQLSDNS